ncbi:MAG: hypothetical protein U0228_00075 [Myxococcaceae bacterium]
MTQRKRHAAIAPFLDVEASFLEDDEHVALELAVHERSYSRELLRADLKRAKTTPPFLAPEALELAAPRARYRLPTTGVTLSALWQLLDRTERADTAVRVLSVLATAGPLSSYPRAGVLCFSDGSLQLCPVLNETVLSAAKTWNPPQFDEYCLGGGGDDAPVEQSLGFSLLRLLLGATWTWPWGLAGEERRVPRASDYEPWLAPLDGVLERTLQGWLSKDRPLPTDRTLLGEWTAALAVLCDEREQQGFSLARLVERAWPVVHDAQGW